MARGPLKNKAEDADFVPQRFPYRVGNRIISDQPLTPAQAKAQRDEGDLLERAREARKRARQAAEG